MEFTAQQMEVYWQRQAHATDASTSDYKARRAAKKAGMRICKARGRRYLDNYGGYQILDDRNDVVAGVDFGLNAQDVVEYCKSMQHAPFSSSPTHIRVMTAEPKAPVEKSSKTWSCCNGNP